MVGRIGTGRDRAAAVRFVGLGCLLALLGGCSVNDPLEDRTPGPAVWEVEAGSGKVYLFGRMAVPGDTTWLTPQIERVFTESRVLWLENPAVDAAQANAYIAEHGFEEGYSVLNAVDVEDRARVTTVLERAGMSSTDLDGRRAWLAYLLLANATGSINGIDGASSPDARFRELALTRGKQVRSEWQDFRQFADFATGLPESTHLEMIRKTLDDAESYEALLDAWLRGDLEALERIGRDWAALYPDAYEHINARRNRAWLTRIQEMLSRGDVQFVCIGIGHYLGPDNLLSLLEGAGLSVRRL